MMKNNMVKVLLTLSVVGLVCILPCKNAGSEEHDALRIVKVVVGKASYYNKESVRPYPDGRYLTANGDEFNDEADTAAHRSLPFGTVVRVTNLNNGKFIFVTINDRGPFCKKEKRIIDLTEGVAKKIGMTESGTARVKLEILASR